MKRQKAVFGPKFLSFPAAQGETIDELLANLREAIEGCLSIDVVPSTTTDNQRVFEIAV